MPKTTQIETKDRQFMMLQGPHGPFFWRLGQMLRDAGATVWRVGFNAGDGAFWHDSASLIRFTDAPDTWAAAFTDLLAQKQITDIVLYGDTRPIHAQAIEIARAKGIRIHVFEEGYLRPYWVTYERDGSNGNSALMGLDVTAMRTALDQLNHDNIDPPARWGEMRHHIFYGALYHWFVMFWNWRFRQFKRHRALPVWREFLLYFKALITTPFRWATRERKTSRILRSGHPFHIALLQLEHDTSFQVHSDYDTQVEFMRDVIEGFAAGAPTHHHLVFKAHPLETHRLNLISSMKTLASEHGVRKRVHYVRGGKLQRLLYTARSAITVNSTAGQQVLSLGLPIKAMGRAVYNKPEFMSAQDISAFFAAPERPDTKAYRSYRQFLLETSQIPGGFYAARGRRQVLRVIVDLMLAEDAPYDALIKGTSIARQPQRAHQ